MEEMYGGKGSVGEVGAGEGNLWRKKCVCVRGSIG